LACNRFWNQLFNRICEETAISVSIMGQKVFMPENSYYLVKELRGIRKNVKFMFYKARMADLIRVVESHIQVVVRSRVQGGLELGKDTP
jgi:hypothetical protein